MEVGKKKSPQNYYQKKLGKSKEKSKGALKGENIFRKETPAIGHVH